MSSPCPLPCGQAEASGLPAPYRRRRPEHTIAYQVVQQHLETWLAAHREANPDDEPIPGYVERDLRKYLECGILACGFARARCTACGHDFLIAYSCKGRGICPSCNTRRMVETAAHLVDHVFPAEPVRQWVVSLPKRLRYFLIRDARLLNRVVRIALNEMERAIRDHSLGAPGAPGESGSGGVVFIHRFGSALNVHIHVHACLIDGLIGRTSEGLSFHPVQLDEADITAVSEAIRRRVLRLFERRGLLSDDAARGMRQWDHGGGFSVHGAVRVHGNDRAGRERLFRYCARPLFAAERLVWEPGEQRLRYQLPQPGHRGETVLMLTPLEFLDRIALLIPPPRRHRHRYFGVLAPNSPWRQEVTARAGVAIETEGAASPLGPPTGATEEAPSSHPARYLWAMLLARIYEIFPLTCHHCGGEVRLIAFVTEVAPIRQILEHIGEPTKPPRVHPPRAPPGHSDEPRGEDHEEDFIQDHFDHEFDQTVSW